MGLGFRALMGFIRRGFIYPYPNVCLMFVLGALQAVKRLAYVARLLGRTTQPPPAGDV